MRASIFLAVFLGLVLARIACWAFVQTIWLPLTHQRDTGSVARRAWRPAQEDPGPALVTIQGPNSSKGDS